MALLTAASEVDLSIIATAFGGVNAVLLAFTLSSLNKANKNNNNLWKAVDELKKVIQTLTQNFIEESAHYRMIAQKNREAINSIIRTHNGKYKDENFLKEIPDLDPDK